MSSGLEGPDFQAAFEVWHSPAVILDRQLRILACNRAYEALVHRDRSAILHRHIFEAFPVDSQQRVTLENSFNIVLQTGKPDYISNFRYEISSSRRGGKSGKQWIISNSPLISATGEVSGILNCPMDASRLIDTEDRSSDSGAEDNVPLGSPSPQLLDMQSLLDAERTRLHQLFHQAPGFICILEGPRHVYALANDAYYQLVGHREIIGHEVSEVLPEVVPQGFLKKLDHVFHTGEPFIGRALPIELQRIPNAVMERRYIDLIYQPIYGACNKVTGIFVQGHDVTEAFSLSQEIAFQAAHDPLTNLLNRREFSLLAEQLGEDGPHSLLYMDLDHFKIVNDRCGHAAGDRLLQEVAAVLQMAAGEGAALARLGGDEFALLKRRCSGESAVELAQQLRKAVEAISFVWEGKRYGVTLSVGVAEFSLGHGVTFEEALGYADAACHLAKEAGRNRVKYARPSDGDVWTRLSEMDNATRLKEAIRDDRVVLYAQRIVDLDEDGGCSQENYEILARLRDADGALVLPSGFIPAAERFGLIEELDRHVITKLFEQLNAMHAGRRSTLHYFVNVSGYTLGSPTFLRFIYRILEAYPAVLSPQICFEVTETAAISNLRRCIASMQTLCSLGFRFAVDDFGSGMASFSYLRQLPVQFVKIDGDFIKAVSDDSVAGIIVESVVKIARTLGMSTIAESVESREQLPKLRSLGVTLGQGFALHQPEPLEAVVGR